MATPLTRSSEIVRRLARPEGRVAYTVEGRGPLVVCAPGMGDLRSAFGPMAAAMVDAGYRVARTDLRGHGDSDTTFTEHGDDATGRDLLAVVDHLGGPAVLVGSSMGAAAALWAAAERPDVVAGVVLLGPFVRDADVPAWRARLERAAIRLSLLRPWGAAAWATAYRSFAVGTDHRPRADRGRGRLRGRLPEGFDAHVTEIRHNLRDPGRLRSLRDLVGVLTHRVVEERLADVRAPALVVMGAQDPDFPSPADELAYIEDRLAGAPVAGVARVRTVLAAECGHYPHLQRADLVAPATLELLAELVAAGLLPGAAHDAGGPDA